MDPILRLALSGVGLLVLLVGAVVAWDRLPRRLPGGRLTRPRTDRELASLRRWRGY